MKENKDTNIKGAAYWKSHSVEEYDAEKDRLIEEAILHLMHPKSYGMPRWTLDEVALALSPDKDHVLSKMTICKEEMKALAKIKVGLAKLGIKNLSDTMDTAKDREEGSLPKTSLCHS